MNTVNGVGTAIKGVGDTLNQTKQIAVTFWQGVFNGESRKQPSFSGIHFIKIGQDAGKQFFSSMTSDLSTFFNNVFTGQLSKASQVFANFGNSLSKDILKCYLPNDHSRWVASKLWSLLGGPIGGAAYGEIGSIGAGATLSAGGAFAAAPLLHDGGAVGSSWANPVVAHDGLAVDEVPAVLQSGEGVLSRDGMNNLSKLNNGNGMNGGGHEQINANDHIVQAWDANRRDARICKPFQNAGRSKHYEQWSNKNNDEAIPREVHIKFKP